MQYEQEDDKELVSFCQNFTAPFTLFLVFYVVLLQLCPSYSFRQKGQQFL